MRTLVINELGGMIMVLLTLTSRALFPNSPEVACCIYDGAFLQN